MRKTSYTEVYNQWNLVFDAKSIITFNYEDYSHNIIEPFVQLLKLDNSIKIESENNNVSPDLLTSTFINTLFQNKDSKFKAKILNYYRNEFGDEKFAFSFVKQLKWIFFNLTAINDNNITLEHCVFYHH